MARQCHWAPDGHWAANTCSFCATRLQQARPCPALDHGQRQKPHNRAHRLRADATPPNRLRARRAHPTSPDMRERHTRMLKLSGRGGRSQCAANEHVTVTRDLRLENGDALSDGVLHTLTSEFEQHLVDGLLQLPVVRYLAGKRSLDTKLGERGNKTMACTQIVVFNGVACICTTE